MRDIERAIRKLQTPTSLHRSGDVSTERREPPDSSDRSDMESALSRQVERTTQPERPVPDPVAGDVEGPKVEANARPGIGVSARPVDSGSLNESSDHKTPITLPLRDLERAGFLTPDRPKDRLSEQFRRIKRPLLKNLARQRSSEDHSNIIMVTSAVSGEGKTYSAINLAMSLAQERERTVILIDADVLKGTASTWLGIDAQTPGLTDLLDDRVSNLDASMFETNVPDLKFVPAGKRSENATELLTSGKMRELINELALRHQDRIVVLDCSPILQTNEANVLIDHAGQVVFVIASEATSQGLVNEALSHFEDDKNVGILLNKASTSGAAYDYNYGYR